MIGVEPAPAVVEIVVADDPEAWSAAGFAVDDHVVQIGAIGVRLIGRGDGQQRVCGWTWFDLPGTGPIDGLVTSVGTTPSAPPGHHANGSTIVDHVVVATPHLERTIAGFEARGLEVRRVRDTDQYGAPFRQVFFRGGETIIELIGPVEADPNDDRPARFYGLAFTVADLDAAAAHLGDGLGAIKDAVQPGRRIATLRHLQYNISIPIALMSA